VSLGCLRRFFRQEHGTADLTMSENQTAPMEERRRTGLDWFAQCLLIGLVISLGVNAVSYFFLSNSIVDLLGSDRKVAEAIGFPKVFWSDELIPLNTSYSVSILDEGYGAINYDALGWNLMLGVILGAAMGSVTVLFRHRMNALADHQRQRRLKSTLAGGYFQISMLGILAVTTVVAATIAVGNQFGSIQRKPVDSSNIASVGHSSFTKTLEVQFHSGSVYQYFQVPTKVYQEFKSADSLGKYLSKNIKGKFPFDRSSNKKTSVLLLYFLMLGPLYLLTFAILLNRTRWKTKITLAVMLGAAMICAAMSAPVRADMKPDRVLMGIFVFWTPQIAMFVLLQTIMFAAQSLFFESSVKQWLHNITKP